MKLLFLMTNYTPCRNLLYKTRENVLHRKISELKSYSCDIRIYSIINHYSDILNFDPRSNNAATESFNAKIKNFRLQLRGVRDKSFFLFKLAKLFAWSTFGTDPKINKNWNYYQNHIKKPSRIEMVLI